MENAPMHRPMRQASRQVRNIDQLHAIVEACHTVRIGALDEEGMFIVPRLPKDARQSFSIANHVSLSKWISRTA